MPLQFALLPNLVPASHDESEFRLVMSFFEGTVVDTSLRRERYFSCALANALGSRVVLAEWRGLSHLFIDDDKGFVCTGC